MTRTTGGATLPPGGSEWSLLCVATESTQDQMAFNLIFQRSKELWFNATYKMNIMLHCITINVNHSRQLEK